MKLTSLPDGKFVHQAPADTWFTVGKDYTPIREVGNGVVVEANNGDHVIIVKSRLE